MAVAVRGVNEKGVAEHSTHSDVFIITASVSWTRSRPPPHLPTCKLTAASLHPHLLRSTSVSSASTSVRARPPCQSLPPQLNGIKLSWLYCGGGGGGTRAGGGS